MPGLLESLENLFGCKDLYEVLQVDKSADANQIKKAYHKISLKVHPDRAQPKDREEATKKFQALGAVYKILSDTNSRGLYDESGEIDEEEISADNRDWSEYWRILFKQVTLEDIKNFEKKYKESKEEEEDLKKAYVESEGNMDTIIDTVLCATAEDESRFAKKIHAWIQSEEVPAFEKFVQETKENKSRRKKRAEEEAKEAEVYAKELGLDGSENSLQNLIMKRQEKRAAEANDFFEHLAAKYGGSGGKKSKKGGKKK